MMNLAKKIEEIDSKISKLKQSGQSGRVENSWNWGKEEDGLLKLFAKEKNNEFLTKLWIQKLYYLLRISAKNKAWKNKYKDIANHLNFISTSDPVLNLRLEEKQRLFDEVITTTSTAKLLEVILAKKSVLIPRNLLLVNIEHICNLNYSSVKDKKVDSGTERAEKMVLLINHMIDDLYDLNNLHESKKNTFEELIEVFIVFIDKSRSMLRINQLQKLKDKLDASVAKDFSSNPRQLKFVHKLYTNAILNSDIEGMKFLAPYADYSKRYIKDSNGRYSYQAYVARYSNFATFKVISDYILKNNDDEGAKKINIFWTMEQIPQSERGFFVVSRIGNDDIESKEDIYNFSLKNAKDPDHKIFQELLVKHEENFTDKLRKFWDGKLGGTEYGAKLLHTCIAEKYPDLEQGESGVYVGEAKNTFAFCIEKKFFLGAFRVFKYYFNSGGKVQVGDSMLQHLCNLCLNIASDANRNYLLAVLAFALSKYEDLENNFTKSLLNCNELYQALQNKNDENFRQVLQYLEDQAEIIKNKLDPKFNLEECKQQQHNKYVI